MSTTPITVHLALQVPYLPRKWWKRLLRWQEHSTLDVSLDYEIDTQAFQEAKALGCALQIGNPDCEFTLPWSKVARSETRWVFTTTICYHTVLNRLDDVAKVHREVKRALNGLVSGQKKEQ